MINKNIKRERRCAKVRGRIVRVGATSIYACTEPRNIFMPGEFSLLWRGKVLAQASSLDKDFTQ